MHSMADKGGERRFAAICINDNSADKAAVLFGQLKISFRPLSESQQRIQWIHNVTANNLNLTFVGVNRYCNFVFQILKINNR